MIKELKISELRVSDANVRKTKVDQGVLDELKASIRSHGLLENLVVVGDEKIGYEVVAGSLRLQALQELMVEDGHSGESTVPCVIGASDLAGELSLAENTVRIAMHPADQVGAFCALYDKGQTLEQIAARFGLSPRLVEQRVRLGGVASELLQVYREGGLTLEALEAFTITTDQEKQRQIYKDLAEKTGPHGGRVSPWRVREILTATKVDANSEFAKFVGREAYEAAGGSLTEDLFPGPNQEHVYFDDIELVIRLANEKLEEAAEKLRKQGWKWVELDPRSELQTYNMQRHNPVAVPTAKESGRLKELRDENLKMGEEGESLDTDARDERMDEITKIERKVRSRQKYTTEQKGTSGCVLTISIEGKTSTLTGIIKPEDRKDANKVKGLPETQGSEPEAKIDPRREVGLTNPVADDVKHIRTMLTKSMLLTRYDVAMDLLTFQLGRRFLYRDAWDGFYDMPLGLDPKGSEVRPIGHESHRNKDEFAAESPGEVSMNETHQWLVAESNDWLNTKLSDVQRWSAFRELDSSYQQLLLVYCLARMIPNQLSCDSQKSSVLEAAIREIQPSFEKARPSVALFWARLSKSTILGIVSDVISGDAAAALSGKKKGELAASVHDIFRDPEEFGLDVEQAKRVRAWTLPGFAPTE